MTRAVQLMADGKHVRLNSPAEIKPLLDEVDRQATAQGYSRGNEPAWDLGNISVKGTRLFNEQTRGIPRSAMPQLNGPALPGTEAALLAGGANKFIELDSEFRKKLKSDGIDVRNERVPAGNLRATQTQLTAATVAGITRAAESGNPKVRHMLREPIWVTKDNYVIDGHHRWASDEALAFSGQGPGQIEVQRINLPVRLAIPYANQFAQQMGIEARPIGNAHLVDSANVPLFLQVLDFRFDPGELRDDRGKWAKFAAVGEAADIMRSNREGFSVSLHSGDTPKQGYMVAQTDHTHVFPETVLDDRKALTTAIDEMLMSERSAFEDRDTYLGGWVHDGKLWLEPSDNITNKATAVREAAQRNQIAIWDVNNGAEIQTGGTGGGRITEHANPQGDRGDPGWLLGPPGGRAAGGSGEDSRAGPVGIAAQVLEFRFDPLELRDRKGRWTKGRSEQMNLHKLMRAAADPFVGAPDPNEPALKAAVTRVATPASEVMPRVLGESHEEWNGQVKLFHYDDNKQILAELDWNGDLRIATNVAQALQDGMSVPGPVHFPDAFEVVAHEMIHGVVPAGSAKANKEAYQKWSISRIEEGFTELGATYHAAEFFDQLGIGDRESGPWPGHTVHEMAVMAARPGEIEQGNAWRHYEGPTKDAQDWVQQVAREEGIQDLGDKAGVARVVELSDEVNRQGAAGKVGIMAQQLARAMTKDPKLSGDSTFIDDLTVKIAASILHEWNTDNPDGAAKQAYSAARAVALQTVAEKQREMAERGAAA